MKRFRLVPLLLAFVSLSPAWPCATHGNPGSHLALKDYLTQANRAAANHVTPRPRHLAASSAMPTLPTDWGGPDALKWRPEAILANAVSRAMNQAWSSADVRDVAIAVPVRLLDNGWRQYGDGQTNAAPSFEEWKEPRPPLVATASRIKTGKVVVRFRFDRALKVQAPTVRIDAGQGQVFEAPLTAQADGDAVAEWIAPAGLGLHSGTQARVLRVKPSDWQDSFPLWFRHPVLPVQQLVKALPPGAQKLSDGRPLPDPEGARSQKSPFEFLFDRKLGAGFSVRYDVPYVHARYQEGATGEAGVVTGVGRGWTWVMENGPASFKTLYTCFERRRPDLELARDGGVASGGGWHRIGEGYRNFGETILNSVESGPILVAAGTSLASETPKAAYGLNGIAVFRFLRPGEGFVTTTEASGWGFPGGKKPEFLQYSYHWFLFHQDREVCTEEWVHPCLPTESNGIGFRCGA